MLTGQNRRNCRSPVTLVFHKGLITWPSLTRGGETERGREGEKVRAKSSLERQRAKLGETLQVHYDIKDKKKWKFAPCVPLDFKKIR